MANDFYKIMLETMCVFQFDMQVVNRVTCHRSYCGASSMKVLTIECTLRITQHPFIYLFFFLGEVEPLAWSTYVYYVCVFAFCPMVSAAPIRGRLTSFGKNASAN